MRYKGAYGGRGGAKSHFFAEQMMLAAMSGKRCVCIREVQKSIKDSVKQLIEDKIRLHGLESHFDCIETEIRTRSGGLIVFKGMQSYNADNIKSLEGFDIAWVEEAQTLSGHSLDLLRPTIRKPGSELWFSWNPRYKTDAVDMFFRGKYVRDDAIAVQINWNDNPWFKDTPLYQDMLADYLADEDKATHVWGGEYGQVQGAILAKWVNQANRDGRITNDVLPDRNGSPVIVSCDIGFRDTCGWWYWQPVVGGFNVLKYDFDHGLDADDWIPRVKKILTEMNAPLGKIYLPHDARAKTFQSKHSSIEKFIKAFGTQKCAIVPNSRKADRIEAGREVIKRCAFNEKECEDGLDGLRAWEFDYNDDAGVFSREPKHNWASHPADAFTYGCQVVTEQPLQKDKRDFIVEPIIVVGGESNLTIEEIWNRTPAPASNHRI